MPDYQYYCPVCNKDKIITCKMSQYSPTTICECGTEIQRKVEDLIANYKDGKDFYGKVSN